jgi:DDB1- and CUL4-associated factor 13
MARVAAARSQEEVFASDDEDDSNEEERLSDDLVDLPWTAVLKRTFEGYIRGERPNMYGEWIRFE